ncbi:MAG: adenylate kinase [Solobacterium sp.]|nr:adenylate kinase [Solobacterium sp.]
MKKIIVTGCPGSGKSVFSGSLGEITGIPVIHLDNIWWRKDRTHISREAFDAQLARILKSETWIIDGDYSRTYEPRIQACDTVIFLDYSEETCMNGIEARIRTERPDIPWTETELDPELANLVQNYRSETRPVFLKCLSAYPEKDVHIFKRREEASVWLSSLKTGSAVTDTIQITKERETDYE